MDENQKKGITHQNSLNEMEETLNALLADLQTNLNKVSPHPASSLHHTTAPQYQQYHPSTTTTVQTTVKTPHHSYENVLPPTDK
ncbi:hypothetical protein Anas_04491, partial [Armadillidium nasatum]